MDRFKHSIALVTGATSGLGHAAARMLAAGGRPRSSSPDAAWPRSGKRPISSKLRPTSASLHAAGAGSQRAGQRSVRARRARQAWSPDRLPTAQCRVGPF